MKEYKVIVRDISNHNPSVLEQDINQLAQEGWSIKESHMFTQHHYHIIIIFERFKSN